LNSNNPRLINIFYTLYAFAIAGNFKDESIGQSGKPLQPLIINAIMPGNPHVYPHLKSSSKAPLAQTPFKPAINSHSSGQKQDVNCINLIL
jgi:hypothetical protein